MPYSPFFDQKISEKRMASFEHPKREEEGKKEWGGVKWAGQCREHGSCQTLSKYLKTELKTRSGGYRDKYPAFTHLPTTLQIAGITFV